MSRLLVVCARCAFSPCLSCCPCASVGLAPWHLARLGTWHALALGTWPSRPCARGVCLRVSSSRCVCSLRVFAVRVLLVCRTRGMGRDGMGWDGMGWDGMGWDGMGWDGMGAARPQAPVLLYLLAYVSVPLIPILVQASVGWCTTCLRCLHGLVCLYQIKLNNVKQSSNEAQNKAQNQGRGARGSPRAGPPMEKEGGVRSARSGKDLHACPHTTQRLTGLNCLPLCVAVLGAPHVICDHAAAAAPLAAGLCTAVALCSPNHGYPADHWGACNRDFVQNIGKFGF